MCVRFSSSNLARDFSSRLKSCTTAIPLTCSCRKALILAIAVRIRRLASRTRLRKKYVSKIMKGNGLSVASASILCHLKSTVAMAISSTKSLSIATTPDANKSFSASTSEVTRVTSLPTGFLSKNAGDIRCRCRKICRRKSNITFCPVHCIR